MSQPTNILINHKEKKIFCLERRKCEKNKKILPYQKPALLLWKCIRSEFSTHQQQCVVCGKLQPHRFNKWYWYGNAEKYFFATLHNWVYLVYSEREVWLAKSACQHLKGPWILSPSISLASYGVVSDDEKWWEMMRSEEW